MMSDEVLLDFCRALTSTVRSGLTLSDAFETLSKSSRHGRMLARASEMTARGIPLHQAFAAQGVFPAVFIALLRAGEEGGKIDEFLELYSGCLEVRVKFSRQVTRMLVYPLFVIALAGVLFLAVSFKVVPMVMEPLMKSGIPLPSQTLFFSSLADMLYASWYKILLVGALGILFLRWLLLSWLGRRARGLASHWLPLYRYATVEARLYYIYTTIGLLLKAGLPLGTMIDVLLQFSQDDLITRHRLRRASGLLSAGTSFSRSTADLMQEDDRVAMEIAEKAGRLDDTLLSRAKLHYDRHLHRMKILVTAFNISTMLAIALVCFGLIMTVAWPAMSVLSGTQAAMRGLGFSDAAAGTPARVNTEPPSPEDVRTKAFNEEQGRMISGYMRQSGKAAGESGEASPKKLSPVEFNKTGATGIQPTSINGH